MNKLNKILSSVLVIIICGFVMFAGKVDASIKETTDAGNTTYDHIENGTKIVGISKFNPNTVLTAKRAAQATMNDVAYNLNNANYDGVHIYYYYYGWYEFDENNNSTPITDSSFLDELNIFYVDNVEKKVTVNYSGDATNLSFKTDKANKDREISYANGIITVPATVKNMTVFSNNVPQAIYAKADESDMTFLSNPFVGKISLIDSNMTSFVEEQSLTIQGQIPFKINSSSENGNFVTVGIEAFQGLNATTLTAEQKRAIQITVRDARSQEGDTFSWGEDAVGSTRKIDILFDDVIREASIDIVWEQGNVQTFKVYLTDSSILAKSPDGTINTDFSTGIDHIKADLSVPGTFSASGRIDGTVLDDQTIEHRIGVFIHPNEKYASVDETSVSFEVKGNDSADTVQPAWETYRGKRVIHYTPNITEENRIVTVEVTWEPGFTQIFTIDASGIELTMPTAEENNEEID